MSQEEWFYELLSEEFGPVPADQIRLMLQEGALAASDRIRKNGSHDWMPAMQLPPATPDGVDQARELHDLSELSFSFEPSETKESDSRSDNELDIDSFNIASEPEPAELDEPPIDDMGIDSFNIQGDSDSEQPKSQREESQEAEFYVESLGQVLGPMPLEEVVLMAESGALTDTDRIREGTTADWASSLSVTEVAAAILAAVRHSEGKATTIGSVTAKRLQSGSTEPQKKAPEAPANLEDSPEKPATRKSPSAKPDRPKKKSKKRKAPKKDELLEEIFSEVFTEDGQVREDREPSVEKPAAAATIASPSPSPIQQSTPPVPQQPTPAVAKSPPPKPPTPPRAMPRPKPKKSSGDGFSLPEPKILGMIGGGLTVVLLLAAVMTGMVSLPGFAPDVDEFLASVTKDYGAISTGPIPPDKWTVLKTRVSTEGRAIITHYSKAGKLSDEDNKKRWAVAKLLELVNCDPADQEKRDKVFQQYRALR